MAFYVEIPESRPRVYELTNVEPPQGRDTWRRPKFMQTPAFIVHSKMHQHEKAQEYVVRGVTKSGKLLVQTNAPTGSEYDKVGDWHEVECGDTTEGYRFKRRVLKPLATLIKLASNVAKTNARVEKQQAHQADRDEKCGACPVCFGDYVVYGKAPRMVHHGYERPGIGYIVGDCHGVDFPPFEISCEGTKSFHERLGQRLTQVEGLLATVSERDSVMVVTGTKYVSGHRVPEHKTIKRGEDGFDRAIAGLRADYVREIEGLKRGLVEYAKHVAEWKPQTFPRVTKKAKTA
jgi:hypothetical protein